MGCECDLGSHVEAVPALKEFGIRGLFVRGKRKGAIARPFPSVSKRISCQALSRFTGRS